MNTHTCTHTEVESQAGIAANSAKHWSALASRMGDGTDNISIVLLQEYQAKTYPVAYVGWTLAEVEKTYTGSCQFWQHPEQGLALSVKEKSF